jgi:AcrR family transcriptional regulator
MVRNVARLVNHNMNGYVHIMRRRGRPGPKDPAETRRRIVEAAVALHEEVGPAATTISAIAERAGVQRLTVYRHFPDEQAVITACSAHWAADHPLPESAAWAGIADPEVRVRTALGALYGHYRRGAGMLGRVFHDEAAVPALAEVMVPVHAWLRELAGQLSAGWGVTGDAQRRVRAAVGHTVRFETWRSLTAEGLSDEEAVALATSLIAVTVLDGP